MSMKTASGCFFIASLCFLGAIVTGFSQQAPPPPPMQPPNIMRWTQEQAQQFQDTLKDQEIIRLNICLDNHVTKEECGPWVQGGVMRVAKPQPQPQAAVQPPQPTEVKPVAEKPTTEKKSKPPKVAEAKK